MPTSSIFSAVSDDFQNFFHRFGGKPFRAFFKQTDYLVVNLSFSIFNCGLDSVQMDDSEIMCFHAVHLRLCLHDMLLSHN